MASKETVKRLSPAATSDLAFTGSCTVCGHGNVKGFSFQVLSLETLQYDYEKLFCLR